MTKRHLSRYCTGPDCLCTRKFYDVGNHLICEYCRKLLYKREPRR